MNQLNLICQDDTDDKIMFREVERIAEGLHLKAQMNASGSVYIMRETQKPGVIYNPIWSNRDRNEPLGYEVEAHPATSIKLIFRGSAESALCYLEGTPHEAA